MSEELKPVAWFIPDDNGKPYRTTGYEHERDAWLAKGHQVRNLYGAPIEIDDHAADAAAPSDDFKDFAKQQGYDLTTCAEKDEVTNKGGTPLATYWDDRTEHAWRGWANRPSVQHVAAQPDECAAFEAIGRQFNDYFGHITPEEACRTINELQSAINARAAAPQAALTDEQRDAIAYAIGYM